MPSIKFSKRVGKALQTGQATVPKEFDSVLDQQLNCPEGVSIDVVYLIEGKGEFKGRLYQSVNNTTSYYQFYLIDSSDKKIFKTYFGSSAQIHFEFDIDRRSLFISK